MITNLIIRAYARLFVEREDIWLKRRALFALFLVLAIATESYAQYAAPGAWGTQGQFGAANVVPAATTPVVTTTALAGGTQGLQYTPQTLVATGGTPCVNPTYQWALASGNLPNGLTLSAAGQIAGTATATGTFNFSVKATDCSTPTPLASVPQSLSITIVAQSPTAPQVQTTSLANATTGNAYNVQLLASGGTPCANPAYTWTLTGGTTLPSGLAIVGDRITGTVTAAAGPYSFAVKATDCGSPNLSSTSQTLFLTVVAASSNLKDENLNCPIGNVRTGAATDGPAQLPITCFYTGTDGTPANAGTVTVGVGGDLQAALNSATCGQIISIAVQPLTLANGWTLPQKACDDNHWIWITSAQSGAAGFPAEHTQATPCAINQATHANYPSYPCTNPQMLMPTLHVSNAQKAIFTGAAGANHYRILGLNLEQAAGVGNTNTLIDMSAGANHIIVDRVLAHGQPLNCSKSGALYTCGPDTLAHGITFTNTTYKAVINSQIYDIYCTQNCSSPDAVGVGIGGNSTSVVEDTVKLYGNLIAAAGESFFSGGGGGGPSTLTPNDGEVRGNLFFKPGNWLFAIGNSSSGVAPKLKNNGELKNWNRFLYEGNVCENSWESWQADQKGFCLVIDPKNQAVLGPNGTASSDGAGNLVALTGSFPTTATDPTCANSGHCKVKFNGVDYQFASCGDTTHCVVTSTPPGGALPPTLASAGFTTFLPGQNPSAKITNVVVRYSEIRGSKNGVQIAAGVSDGNDVSSGISNVSVHDLLCNGLNPNLSNGLSSSSGSQCVNKTNDQAAPNQLNNMKIDHVTMSQAAGVANGFEGVDLSSDSTDTTIDGSTGAYLSNMTTTNNMGPAGGQVLYKLGTLYTPGGLLAGLKQQSCTPAVTGTTCTYTYSKNVHGIGLWKNQTVNKPYPVSNADLTDSPSGTGCNLSGATCFPSGEVFKKQFNSYNYSGVSPPGAVDLLDWMVQSDGATKHLTGGNNPKWSYKDANYINWIKNSSGWAADVQVYDDQFIYNWLTENGDPSDQAACGGACYTVSSAWKMSVLPHPALPRYFVPGTHVIIMIPPVLTAGNVNPYVRTTNCGVDAQPIKYLGNVKFDTFGFYIPSVSWGGDVGFAPTLENDYFYSGNVSGVYANLEKRYFAQGIGWFGYEFYTMVGGAYQLQQRSINNTKVAGGTPPLAFSCGLPFVLPTGSFGQGYKGDYALVSTSPYVGAGTDGKDIGISDWTKFNNYLNAQDGSNPTWTATTYAAPVLSPTITLAGATQASPYSQQLTSTGGAGDFKKWSLITPIGTNVFNQIPAGLSLSLSGLISGTPSAAAGNYVFVVDLMDAVQQHARQIVTIVVSATGTPSATANWQPVPTPASAQQVSDIDFDNNNNWFVSDRTTGFWRSTNQGGSWTQINTGVPVANQACGASHINHDPHNDSMIGSVDSCSGVASATYYRLPAGTTTWIPIPQPGGFSTSFAAQQPRAVPLATNGNLVLGGTGCVGCAIMFSTNDGSTTALSVQSPSMGNPRGLWTNPANGHVFAGGENAGFFESSDGGATFTNIGSPSEIAGITTNCAGELVFGSLVGMYKQTAGSFPSYTFTNEQNFGFRVRAVYRDSFCSIYASQKQFGASNTIWRSTDGGVTYTTWQTGVPTGREAQRYVENAFDGKIYVNIQDGTTNNGAVYSTTK